MDVMIKGKEMEQSFSDIASDTIEYSRRHHRSVQEAASDIGKDCANWVRQKLLTINYDRVKMMIEKIREGHTVLGSNTEEVNLARSIATRQWRYVTHWSVNSEDKDEMEKNDSPPLSDLEKANVVTSESQYEIRGKRAHLPVLDLDCRHAYVPSSTPGNGHLLLDVGMSQENFEKLLNVLAEVGILDQGYVNASLKRGYSAVRLPWIKKEIVSSDPWADIPEGDEKEKEEIKDGVGNLILER